MYSYNYYRGGSTTDHLVTALWHLMGNLKFIVNQNRGEDDEGVHDISVSQCEPEFRFQQLLIMQRSAGRPRNSSSSYYLFILSSLIKYESKLV